MKNLHLGILIAVLLTLAGSIFAYKVIVLDFPLKENDTVESWRIEAHVRLDAQGKDATASLWLPSSENRFGIFDELFFSRDFGLTKSTDAQGNRRATWTAREAKGKADLYYHAEVYRFQSDLAPQKSVADTQALLNYKSFIDSWDPIRRAVLQDLFEKYKKQSADIDSFIAVAVADISHDSFDETRRLILRDQNDDISISERATGLAILARMLGYPARPVRGVDLSLPGRQVQLVHWIEVLKEGQWQAYDIVTGKPGVSPDYLPWWRGLDQAALVTGAKLRGISFSVSRQIRPQIMGSFAISKIQKTFLSNMTLFKLPIETQQVYRIILMVPIGALLIIFLRQIIGLKTFGTFMPVLIALAFRETDLIAGTLMFVFLVATGLVFRFYFEKLKLLSVPRLAAVMTVVIILMVALSMVLERLGVGSGLSVALFPLVILTMTIERMSVIWEEYGARESIERGLFSMVAAILAYLLMSFKPLSFYLFVYPELLLAVLATAILLGRYTGYRLTELYRFKSFIDDTAQSPSGDKKG